MIDFNDLEFELQNHPAEEALTIGRLLEILSEMKRKRRESHYCSTPLCPQCARGRENRNTQETSENPVDKHQL